MPCTASGMSGAAVIAGVRITSRTLNTLMPKVSRRPVRASTPRVKSRISSLFVPARRVRASMFFSSSDMILCAARSDEPDAADPVLAISATVGPT